MQMRNKICLIFALVILAGVSCVQQAKPGDIKPVVEKPVVISDITKFIDILDGEVYSKVMEKAEIGGTVTQKIYDAAKSVYDLAKIRSGKKIELVYDGKTLELKKFIYKINTEDQLIVNIKPELQAAVEKIPYETKIKTAHGEVKTSMYAAALENGIDERAIIDLADAFQLTIDFATDPQAGDAFSMVYEERYLNGKYVMPAQILAGRYINSGRPYEIYFFRESADNEGYFDQNGNSVQKMFLKAPVQFKYITSGFTSGLRYVSNFNVATRHRAIDYAAPTGTPIRSVGDGTVVSAGWSKAGYGNLTSIRHNGTYTTNYAHQSRIIVRRGQKVKQSQIIGYVGTTGFSTGPHLHFEMVKNGVKINPLREILPPGQKLSKDSLEKFQKEIEKYKDSL